MTDMDFQPGVQTTLRHYGDVPFSVLPNEVMELLYGHCEAMAIYAYLQSRPSDWEVRKEDIMKNVGLGEDRYSKGRKVLVSAGLWHTAIVRDESGKATGREIWAMLYPVSDAEFKKVINRNAGKPVLRSTEIPGFRYIGKPVQLFKSKDKTKEKEKHIGGNRKRFSPPTLDEVRAYAKERNSSVDPQKFHDYYEAGDWKDQAGKPVKNWKQKLITWERKETTKQPQFNPFEGALYEGHP